MKRKSSSGITTLIILIIAFLSVSAIGLFMYGWSAIVDTMLKYAIGSTATALFIIILGWLFRRQIGNTIKEMMR